ncbi:hypothetical protein [Microbacterium gorillae]|uniref:hypothetical protein n=1 Tax=Microbacterium gorillae TaxID=1231063 RepID=UPI003D97692A
MSDESTREPQPDPTGDSNPHSPKQPNGWQAQPAHEWEQRPNHAWQTGAPEAWGTRPNDTWQTGAPQSWDTRPNPLWQGGTPSETAPTVPLPADATPQPTAPTEPLTGVYAPQLTAPTEPLAGVYAPPPPTVAPPQYEPPAPYGTPPQYAPAQYAPAQYASRQYAAEPYGVPPVTNSSPPYGAPTPPSQTPPPGYGSPAYPATPVPEPRRRTGLWIGVGAVIVAVVIALIVIFAIWIGNQAQSLFSGAGQPVMETSESAAPRPTPSAPQSTENPSTAPTTPAEQSAGGQVPLDVASGLPEGADFAVAPGSTWADYGSTFLGGDNGEFWATSLTGMYGEIGGEDAQAAAEDLLRLLSVGSVEGVESVWVTGADGRSYEFLATESEGMGVMVRVEPASGRQFALMFTGDRAEILANLILK